MDKAGKNRLRTSPSLLACLLALLAAGATVFLCWLALFTGLGVFQSGNLTRAQNQLLSARLDESRRSFSLLARPPFLLSLARLADKRESRANRSAALALLEVLDSLDNRRCAQADTALANFLREHRGALRSAANESPLASELEKMHAGLSECAQNLQALRASRADLEQIRIRKVNFEKQYASIAWDFAGLLSLKPLSQGGTSISLAPYQAGVLQGLPRIADLEDGLADLKTLKSELARLGGEVRVLGSNTYTAFMNRLEDLRNAATTANAEWNKAGVDQQVLQYRIKELDEGLEKFIHISRKKLSYVVYRLGEVEIDPHFLATLSAVRARLP